MNKKGALISRDFRNSSFFLSLFPLFTRNSNISHVYIFVVQFANHTVRRWKFFSFSRNRVTRVGHISFFNDQRQSIEAERIEEGISFDNSISSSSQKKNPSFLPFFPLLLLLFRTLADRSLLRRIRGIYRQPRYIEAANKRVRKLAQKSPASLSLRLLDSNQGLRVPIRDSHCAWVYREYEPQGREKERERERGEWIFSLSPSPRNAPTKSTGGGDDNDKDDYDYDDYDSYSTRRERHLSRPIMRDSLISRLHGSTACTTACFLCQHARHPPLF